MRGILREEPNNTRAPIYVQKPDGNSLTSSLLTLHHNGDHHNIQEYRCYIPLPDRSVLTAFLHPFNPQQDRLRSMSIFVRGPVRNTLFAGILQHIDGYRPEWLPY